MSFNYLSLISESLPPNEIIQAKLNSLFPLWSLLRLLVSLLLMIMDTSSSFPTLIMDYKKSRYHQKTLPGWCLGWRIFDQSHPVTIPWLSGAVDKAGFMGSNFKFRNGSSYLQIVTEYCMLSAIYYKRSWQLIRRLLWNFRHPNDVESRVLSLRFPNRQMMLDIVLKIE